MTVSDAIGGAEVEVGARLRRWFRPLRQPRVHLREMLIALIATSVMTGVALWSWAAYDDYREALAKAASDSRFLARVVEQHTNASIRAAFSVLHSARHQLEAHAAGSLPYLPEELEQWRSLAASLSEVSALEITDFSGRVLFSTEARPEQVINPQTLAAHQAGADQDISGSIFRADKSGYFTISEIFRREGKPAGIVLAKIELSSFKAFYESLQGDGQMVLGVMRDDFTTVERYPLGSLPANPDRQQLPMFRELSERSHGTYHARSRVDDVDRFVSYDRVTGLPLIAYAGVPRERVLASFRLKQYRSVGYLATGLSAIGLLGAIMLRNLRREERLKQRSVTLARDLNLAIDVAGLVTFDYNVSTRDITWGGELEALLGGSGDDTLTAPAFLSMIHPDDRIAEELAIRTAIATAYNGTYCREFRIVAGGEVRWVALRARILVGSDGDQARASRIIGVLRDVTGRYELMQKKDNLLREVNHRVMNSLQVLCSMLSLQARSITDEDERKRFDTAVVRVASLATVHGRLFRTLNLERIEVGAYLKGLCADLSRSLGPQSGIEISGEETGTVLATTDQIMPLGLAFAELVTGAAATALAEPGSSKLVVTFTSSPSGSRLTIARRRPAHQRNSQAVESAAPWCDAFGASLAQMMITQVGGVLRWEGPDDSRFVVDLPWAATATPV